MTMFQRKRIKEISERMDKKADSLVVRAANWLTGSKRTAWIVLAVIIVVIVALLS